MQRSSSATDSKGNKVIVVRSDDYYNNLSPIKVLQPIKKVEIVRKAPALCNRIVIGARGKDKVNTSMVGCDTCRYNMPSSSSHACGNFPEGSQKPLNKQVNILRKSRTARSPSRKRRDNFSIDEVGTKKTVEFGKIHKRAPVRRSRGPRSTSNLVKDATPKKINVSVIDLTTLSDAINGTSPAQERGGDFGKPGPLYSVSKKALNSNFKGNPKRSSYASRNVVYIPRRPIPIIDLTTSSDPKGVLMEPEQSPAEDVDESTMLGLLDQHLGNILDTKSLIKKEQTDSYPETVTTYTNLSYSLLLPDPVRKKEIPIDYGGWRIKEEELSDEFGLVEYTKMKSEAAYNKFIKNLMLNSSGSGCNLFTPHQLTRVPDKIFESPIKTKRQSMNSHDRSLSNIPQDLFDSFSKVNSAVTLDELHNSVEIKKEIISTPDLVDDDDILKVLVVGPDNTSEKQSYSTDPPICVTFKDVKSHTNDVDALQTSTGNPQKTSESATSSAHCVDPTKDTKDPAVSFKRASPVKIWEIPPENINLDVELPELSRNTHSPLSELLDIVFNAASEPAEKANEAVEHPDLVERALIDSLAKELAESTSNISKETNETICLEARSTDYLGTVLSNVGITGYVDEGTETLVRSKTVEIDRLETTDRKSPAVDDNTSNPEMENVQIVEAMPRESAKYALEDIFTNIDIDFTTSEIAICSEIEESTKTDDDIVEVNVDTKESVSDTTESVNEEKDTSEEAPNIKHVPEKDLDEDVLKVIHCDHSYGRIVDGHMSFSDLPKPPLAESFATETILVPDNTVKILEQICAETEDVVLIETDTLKPIIDGADKKEEENVPQNPSKGATIERDKTNEIEELESDDIICVDQEANVDKQAVPQDYLERTASSHQAAPLVMTETEISNLKSRIMDGTIKKEEILEIIEGQNLRYTTVNRNLEQRKCDIKHLGDCLKKQIDVMRQTYEYFDNIIEAGVKDLNGNVTESTVRNVMNNLYFIKGMVDKTFAYYDVKKHREKKVGYRVIRISKKDVSQKWKDVPVLRRAPVRTNRNVVRKRVIKSSSKLLTRTLYRMNKLLDALEKRKGVLCSQKSKAFVSKLREMAQKDLSSNVAPKRVEGEGSAETRQDEVVTDDPSVVDLDATQTSETGVKPVGSRKVLNSIENTSSADWNVGFKGFATKITPMSRDIKVILSQIENVDENDTRENIYEELLEKKTRRISKLKVGRAVETSSVIDISEDESTDATSKDFAIWAANKVPEKRETTVENYVKDKQNQKIRKRKEKGKFTTKTVNSESRSRRSSIKPQGFYSESKMFSQDPSDNNTSVLKYDVDCSNLNNSQSEIMEYVDLTYELKNDDKPCVILYNKKEDIKTPIFNSPRRTYEHKTDKALATVQLPKVEETGEPKILDDLKKTDEQPSPHEEPGRVLRNKRKPKPIMPRRSLRSTTMKERNAVKESLKASVE